MARPTTDLEYVQRLVDGQARIFWQSLPREPDPAAIPGMVKDALYRAIAQALRERTGMPLPPNRHQFDCILSAARRRPQVIEFTERGGLSCEGATRPDDRGERATEETGIDRPAAPVEP